MNKTYSNIGVKGLQKYRKTIKSPIKGVSDESYQSALGNLLAAGHITIIGMIDHVIEREESTDGSSCEVHTIKFRTNPSHKGDDPHIRGYLTSGNSRDPKYKIKGWLNKEEKTSSRFRIELVSSNV